jgi:hypothetical protein
MADERSVRREAQFLQTIRSVGFFVKRCEIASHHAGFRALKMLIQT